MAPLPCQRQRVARSLLLLPLVRVLIVAAFGSVATAQNASSVALEPQCARFETAQNASLVLTWQLLAAGAGGPFTRIAHTAAALSAPPRVLIIGGIEYESAQPVVVNTTLVYDPQTDAFRLPVDQIASSAAPIAKDEVFWSPASRAEHTTVVAGPNVVLLFGGQNAAFLNDLWRGCVSADSTTTKWDQFVVPASDAVSLAATPAVRIGHSLVAVYENASHTGALVYGGLSDAYEDVGANVSLALVARASVQGACSDRSPRVHWRTLRIAPGSAQPDPRAYHSAAPVSRLFNSQRIACMLLFGGRSTKTNLIYGDVWRLCPVAGRASAVAVESQVYQWDQLAPIGSRGPGPRYGAAIAFIDEGKVAVAGGSYAFPNEFLSDVWEFNINATQWLSLRFDADFTPPRRGHAIALLGDRLFLFGGRDRYSVVNRRMQVATYAAPYCATGLKITLCEATSTYVCVPCPAGYFLEAGTRNCLPCDAGSYSAEGAATCTKCPTGTYNPLVAQTRLSACVACPTGTYSGVEGAASNATCLPCAAGTFAASTGATSCSSCPAGTFSNASASACAPCAVGQWSGSSAAQCSKCAAGSYNPRNGSAVCFPCPMGFYSDQDSAQCSPCAVNTFSSAVSTAGASGCSSCPALTFTGGDLGAVACKFCPAGSTLSADGGSCQPCAKGTFSRAAETNGACVPCALHSHSNVTTGATECDPCPTGTLTLATGSNASTDCRTCSSATQVFDGQSCASCPAGGSLVAATVPSCEACVPGTYTSSSAEASLSSGCQLCPTMAVAPLAGATACAACPDASYAMAAWRSCISCASSFLSECPLGRNGQVCSGNGVCVLRGCDCTSGWTGGDCSTPSGAALVSAAPSVLYFPYNQTYVVPTRGSLVSTFEIRVKRAGSLLGELRAHIQVKSTNTSSLPAGTFPASVSLASGASETKLTLTTSAFASMTVGSNCRSITLELVDVSSPTSPSMVASEAADRSITIFLDDTNGVNGGSGSSQPRSLIASYTLGNVSEASAALDRAVATKLRLTPPDAISLSSLPLNFRFALDPAASDSAGIANLLPAVIARIQSAYGSASVVRMGSLHPNSSTNSSSTIVYQSASDFYASAKRVANGTTTSVTWQWLTDRIKATNTTQWRVEDGSVRRYLVAFLAAGAATGDTSLLTTTLRQHGLFAFIVLPSGQTASITVPSDVMQLVSLANSVSEIPQKLLGALQQRDASSATTFVASVLADTSTLVQTGSSVIVTMSGTGLPALDLTLNALPAQVASSTVQITLPGFTVFTIALREPGPSCYAAQPPETLLPLNDEPMGGWVGAWHLLSETQWRRTWVVPTDGTTATPPTLQLRRYNDSSLLRTTRTSVLAVTPTGGSRRLTLERTFDGGLVAPGLDLIAKAYARHTASASDGVSCAVSLYIVPANATKHALLQVRNAFTTRPDWSYMRLSSAVPFEVASMRLRLDCNATQAVDTVEWTSLGLFPDPQVACLCPRGFFYDAGACLRCPAGSYCVAGIKRECPLGYFSFGKADHCDKCRDGWICVDGLVRLCELGTYAAPGSSCAVCPGGFACRNGMKLICPAGTFSLPQSSDCQLCPPGTISVNEGASTCSLCPLGSTSSFDRDHCFACPAGETTTFRGQHPCSTCAATFFSSRTEPEVCVAVR